MTLKFLLSLALATLLLVLAGRAQVKAPAAQTSALSQNVAAPHIQLAISQSDRFAAPGGRIRLTAEVKLAPGVHVYAPGAQGYRATELRVQPSPEFALASSAYPQSKALYLAAIKETVPVYEGSFQIAQDVAFSFAPAFIGSLGAYGKTVEVQGVFRYQACDARICYLPESVPVKWQVQVMPLDRQRAPDTTQRK